MLDVQFYIKVYNLKQQLIAGSLKGSSKDMIFKEIEECRSKDPIIYNIETTNACNMRCEMCPRTTMMTRPVETMDMGIFKKIVEQITPFNSGQWEKWEYFVETKYRVNKNDMSENHFFLYVIPKVLVLHGYGDPLLDKLMPERVRLLSKKNIDSYFSCNPANINIDMTEELFKNGLSYIKYSIESVDDLRHKKIRGEASDFSKGYRKILDLLDIKSRYGYKTKIVITMLNLKSDTQEEEFERLKEAFKGTNVYIYLKSQDQKWYQNVSNTTKSIHWIEFCQFPWSSMTIKSNGDAVECVEDFNNEIILGDAKQESLYEIWNGEKYRKFRSDHFNLTKGIKCTEQCDMTLIGNLL